MSKKVNSPIHAQRVALIRADLIARKLDAYLILDRMDQYWLTGFTGEDGGVLVTPKGVTLITDSRFSEAADVEAPWAKKVLRTLRGPASYAKVIKSAKAARVGFDPSHMNVHQFAEISKLLKPAKLVSSAAIVTRHRLCKTPQEVDAIRNAIRIAEQAYLAVTPEIKPGVSEAFIAARLVFEMQARGASGPSFAPIVAFGSSGSHPHYEPTERVLKSGEGVLIDWGCRAGWYISDLTRMVWPTSIPPQLAKVYPGVREAHDRAIAAIRPGVKASAVDKVARDFLRKSGWGKEFGHSLGHGIGLNVHEGPRLGKKADDALKPGMVVTVEPGVYLPGVGGVRLEDDVLVTETGCEVLSSLPL